MARTRHKHTSAHVHVHAHTQCTHKSWTNGDCPAVHAQPVNESSHRSEQKNHEEYQKGQSLYGLNVTLKNLNEGKLQHVHAGSLAPCTRQGNNLIQRWSHDGHICRKNIRCVWIPISRSIREDRKKITSSHHRIWSHPKRRFPLDLETRCNCHSHFCFASF